MLQSKQYVWEQLLLKLIQKLMDFPAKMTVKTQPEDDDKFSIIADLFEQSMDIDTIVKSFSQAKV